jgi:predicted transposase/invertase (TIGR01784 family)
LPEEAAQQKIEQAEQSIQEAIPRLLKLGLNPDQIAEALGLSREAVQTAIAQKPMHP